ncbi:unnamed protein product [Paramecium pentaurelia]|uniref:Transmembrane protein n=1 Tax=Paramecium pentaurelia TaxID=43138 RepID=A0A8S1XU04_9CILI|nr:unnamed protein product [Paramecium pentaurelia]
MIIMLLVMKVACIFPNTLFSIDQEYSLYPTVGEIYEYYLEKFISETQLMCKTQTQVPNVQVINQCEEIYSTQGNQFISISSNNTHFGTLTNNNEVIIYEWKNSMIQQIGSSIKINSSFNCFNIDLSSYFSILVDCFYNNEFILIQFIDGQLIDVYHIQSSVPTQTKIQSIINETNPFIVYAQYFQNYSILTLFSSNFCNQSSLNYQFVDFDITIKINPHIYAITSQEIFQLSISPNSQFNQISNFSQDGMSNFNTINVYYNFQSYSQKFFYLLFVMTSQFGSFKGLSPSMPGSNRSVLQRPGLRDDHDAQGNHECTFTIDSYSQCDQINLIDSNGQIAPFLQCENQIIQVINDLFIYTGYSQIQKILQSNLFIIYQFIDTIIILQQQAAQYYKYTLQNQGNSLLYFNSDNELFSFNQEIIVYKISIASLQVNLTNLEIAGNNNTFSLYCKYFEQFIQFKFYLQVLAQNDTNIYVMFNQDFTQYQTSFQLSVQNSFFGFSGQLLQYQLNPQNIPLKFTLNAQQKICESSQSYQLVQFLSLYGQKYYLIGYINQSLYILQSSQICQMNLLNSINITINASSLQVAYSIYPKMIIIGLRANNAIYLFQYFDDTKNIINYQNFTFQQNFSDYLVTYNSIIILFPNQEIQILTLNFTNTFTLNQQSINILFKNILFNPQQIIVNTQSQSSIFYINNINEVIIISIDQSSIPIPISLMQINFPIKQINLVGIQLIFSYLCNNQQNICFQVWNVQNLPKYYYVKNLYSVKFLNQMIQSDNLFLYITFSNYTVYAYNPQLPYHMSLMYKLELTSPIICTQAIQGGYHYEPVYLYIYSIILLSDNSIYQLYLYQQFEISVEYYNEDFNNSISYPQFIYNYSVTSALNQTAFQQTPNQSIILYSNYTIFLNQRNLSFNLSKDYIIPNTKLISYPMNLFIDRQVEYCNQTLSKYCYLTQFSHQTNNISNFQNFYLMTQINNEFFALQNNFYLQIVNIDLNNLSNINYSYLNFSTCLQSTSYIYQLYSICENNTAQYLLNFTLNSSGTIIQLETTQLPQRVNITKISSVLNQIFILSKQQESQDSILYWLNQSNNTLQMNSISSCQDYSIALIPKVNEDIQQDKIIIFYYYNNYFIKEQIVINRLIITLIFAIYRNYAINIKYNIFKFQFYKYILTELLYFLNDIYFSYIIYLRIEKFSLYSQSNQNGTIIGTIPNYGSLQISANSFYQDGVLMQQFTQNNLSQFIVGVYYLNSLLDKNLMQPILMQGSFNTTNPNYAMIINKNYQNGTSLYFYNQSIYNYPISIWNITCILNSHTQHEINVQIFCQNEFSNGNYNITFYPPHLEQSSKSSIYALISIIRLLLLYFYIKVQHKTKNLGYIKSEIEL